MIATRLIANFAGVQDMPHALESSPETPWPPSDTLFWRALYPLGDLGALKLSMGHYSYTRPNRARTKSHERYIIIATSVHHNAIAVTRSQCDSS